MDEVGGTCYIRASPLTDVDNTYDGITIHLSIHDMIKELRWYCLMVFDSPDFVVLK